MDNPKNPKNPMWGNKSLDSPTTKSASQGTPGVTVTANQVQQPSPAPQPDTATNPLSPPTSTPLTQQPLAAQPESSVEPIVSPTNQEASPIQPAPPQLDPTLPPQTHSQVLQGTDQQVPPAPPTQPMQQNQQAPGQQSQVPSQFVYAGFFRRLVAVIVDALILLIPLALISFVLIFAGVMRGPTTEGGVDATFTLIFNAIMPIISYAYFIFFIGKKGQTPGKKILGIKVIKRDTHEVPGYLYAFLREVVGKFIAGFLFGLGYFWMIWDKDKQTWADKIASTIVIKT